MASHCHVAFTLGDPSGVGEVRRHAVQRAEQLGFGEVAAGRVALIATELGNNLLRHAQGGRMLVGAVPGDDDAEVALELLAIDCGPGIADVAASLADGFSTGGTPGTGLGAVRRLSQAFDLYSLAGQGTVVMSRVTASGNKPRPAGGLVLGAIRLAAPGETVCGDNWSAQFGDGRAALLVADGLGHGPHACEAADAAVAVFDEFGAAAPSRTLEQIHQRLRATRGAAAAIAHVDVEAGTVLFAGVGNIAGRIISGVGDRTLMSQHGTAGGQIRRLDDVRYDWPAHAVVVLHSDGVATRWSLDGALDVLQHHPSIVAGWVARDQIRGRDDATIVVLKRREH